MGTTLSRHAPMAQPPVVGGVCGVGVAGDLVAVGPAVGVGVGERGIGALRGVGVGEGGIGALRGLVAVEKAVDVGVGAAVPAVAVLVEAVEIHLGRPGV